MHPKKETIADRRRDVLSLLLLSEGATMRTLWRYLRAYRLLLSWMLSLAYVGFGALAVDPSQCIAPLGMENGQIKDSDLSASSSFDSGNVGPQHGR
ncbi:unnamed protein product [Acanthoscelides obtectus]|uniref:F5/8 type C domain-containing protein n=1 Tax=Acanthoscelides obtectus TaxID=200917 RepID=A0A9P0VPB7_ACAOB|nr:unnamed protein product [Acanthoscelides obtectus]CAK1674697.1 hypothetical protein AOBTE_LOCUS29710 [Acanthoscelides obtectus]